MTIASWRSAACWTRERTSCAVQSRIHVALRYESIDLGSTTKIWNNLLDRINKHNKNADIKIKFNRDILLEFAQKNYEERTIDETTWNARQIRNAFSTAIAMGQFDRLERITKQGLTPDEVATSSKKSHTTINLRSRNFSKITDAATDFEEYITTVRGHDRDNALESRQRNDYFGRQLAPPRKVYRQHGEETQTSRLQEYATTPAIRSSKGKTAVKRSLYMEEEENDEDEDIRADKSGPRKSKNTKDDDSEEDE